MVLNPTVVLPHVYIPLGGDRLREVLVVSLEKHLAKPEHSLQYTLYFIDLNCVCQFAA